MICDECGKDMNLDDKVIENDDNHICLECFKKQCEIPDIDDAYLYHGAVHTEEGIEEVFDDESMYVDSIMER